MHKLRIAVIRGCPSLDYDLSLKTGSNVLKNMPEHYQAHDIFISKEGKWHREGIERSPDRALAGMDVAFNALHGHYGEDGKIQQLLERLRMPYTGTSSTASALSMNKILAKKTFENHNIKTPYYTTVRRGDDLAGKVKQVFHSFLLPVIVKPANANTSHGITLVKNFNHLEDALKVALEISESALIEEYIKGKEVTVGVIRNFRNEPLYVLLPVEIEHEKGREYYDRESKLNNLSLHKTISSLFDHEKLLVQKLARELHEALNLGHYSRTDMMVHPRRGVFVLETNTQPTFIPGSSFHHSLENVGCTSQEFIDHLIKQALEQQ
jgi:D-alanine-D-alanine ligase